MFFVRPVQCSCGLATDPSALGFVLREFLGTIGLRSIAGLAVLLVALANLLQAADLLDGGRIVDPALTAAFPLVAALVVERLWATSEQEGTLRAWETAWWTLLLAAVGSALLVAGPVLRVAEGLPLLWGTLAVAAALLIGRYRGQSLVEQANSRLRRRGKAAEKTRDE
jgi:hypothetical protein